MGSIHQAYEIECPQGKIEEGVSSLITCGFF
jgi:hypothetical protein